MPVWRIWPWVISQPVPVSVWPMKARPAPSTWMSPLPAKRTPVARFSYSLKGCQFWVSLLGLVVEVTAPAGAVH